MPPDGQGLTAMPTLYVHRCRICDRIFVSASSSDHRCDKHVGMIVGFERYWAQAHHDNKANQTTPEELELEGMRTLRLVKRR